MLKYMLYGVCWWGTRSASQRGQIWALGRTKYFNDNSLFMNWPSFFFKKRLLLGMILPASIQVLIDSQVRIKLAFILFEQEG